MEVGVHEVEDDVFFADLNKQISSLIMDDDDDDPVSLSLQFLSRRSVEQIIKQVNPHILKAKARESLSRDHCRQQGSMGKEGQLHSTPNPTGKSLIMVKKMASRQSFNDPFYPRKG
ncbi:uncharacterized protein LOC120138233 [Hibiscus syriacus]|uniref:uncharacterized protein LOC120138233 n=1 Tax=Hibiscus syriacus TaxID=106335 RepID=UPI0019221C38|nr:uncharacterized protein LOC120138233 [Hibiscus syriacus]